MMFLDFMSIGFIILSFGLLGAVFIRHFKGMDVPPYWIYFLGGFAMLSISTMYMKLVPYEEPFITIDILLRFMASFSIFLGSFDIFRRYESNITNRIINSKSKK